MKIYELTNWLINFVSFYEMNICYGQNHFIQWQGFVCVWIIRQIINSAYPTGRTADSLDAGLLAISQYSEGPATGHLDTGFFLVSLCL